jgi:predicted nucleic acid-binding protein
MAQAHVVADASALICLGWVDQLQLLHDLFGRITIPPAVATEAPHRGSALPRWVDVHPLGRPIDARVSAAHLGPGESEVLCLGLELKDAWLILDDGDARALAHKLRLHVLGTAAVLLEAKRAGFLRLVHPTLDALLARGFRLDRRVYDLILKAAGEAQS